MEALTMAGVRKHRMAANKVSCLCLGLSCDLGPMAKDKDTPMAKDPLVARLPQLYK